MKKNNKNKIRIGIYWNWMHDIGNVRNTLSATMLPHYTLGCIIASVWGAREDCFDVA